MSFPLLLPLSGPMTSGVGSVSVLPLPKVDGAEFILGDDGTNGGGNWPTAEDRALMSPFQAEGPTTAHTFKMALGEESAGGARFKGLVYAADGAGATIGGITPPGTLVASTAASAVVGVGVQTVSLAITASLSAGWYWIGYVADGSGDGAGCSTDSGGTNSARTVMFNQYLSFASPDNPAPEYSGSPEPYSNVPSAWLVCT